LGESGTVTISKRILWFLAAAAIAAALMATAFATDAGAAPLVRNLRQQPPDMWAFGSAPNDDLGWSVATGDINGDGYPDIASGAILAENPADSPIQYQQGALHVYFGKPNFTGIRDSARPGSPDLIIYGAKGESGNLQHPLDSDNLGKGLAMDDVNGDGMADLIVSSMNADSSHGMLGGKVYIFFGRTNWPSVIDLHQTPNAPDLTIDGDLAGGTLGTTVRVGDFNGDGIGDVLMGAPALTRSSGAAGPGGLRVIYGTTSWPSKIDMAAPPAGLQTLKILGQAFGDHLGQSLGVGDLNGDGVTDFVGGAFRGNEVCGPEAEGGKAFVFYGGLGPAAPTGTIDLATTPAGYSVYWAAPGDQLGRRVSIGDVNGDGQPDLLLGARCEDTGGKTDNGAIHILLGPLGTGSRSLATNPADIVVEGIDSYDYFGVGVTGGDANGDGIGDLIMGANGADGMNNTAPDTGEASILFGPLHPGVYDMAATPADVRMVSPDGGDRLGRFLVTTDLNADCTPETVMTAYASGGYLNKLKYAGEVDVVIAPGGGPAPQTVCAFAHDPVAAESGGPDAGSFWVVRSGPTTLPLTVNYAMSGHATNGGDYSSLPGSVTIPAGASRVDVPLVPVQDGAIEPSEDAVLHVAPGGGYTVGTPATASVMISDDDEGLSVSENGSGTGTVTSAPLGIDCGPMCSATFVKQTSVTLTEAPSPGSVFAGWSGACSGSATTCTVLLTQSANVTASFANAASLDVPGPPVSAAAVPGPAEGHVSLTWTPPSSDGGAPVTSYVLSRGPDAAHLAPLATVDVSQTSYDDPTVLSGASYVYAIAASNFVGTGPQAQASVTTPPASVSVGPASAVETDTGGTSTASFPISLSHASAVSTAVSVTVVHGNAVAGSDYQAPVPATTVVTFAPGETSKTFPVTVLGDTASEGNETFTAKLSSPVGVTLGTGQATGTIIDNEGPITASVTDTWVGEGNSGSASMVFSVALSAAPVSGQAVSVNVATANGSAASPGDYSAIAATTLTFAPGQLTKTVTVSVNGDGATEPNETLLLNLSAPKGLQIADGQGVGTIVDDDGGPPVLPVPAVSVGDAWVVEGNSGLVPETFTVSLSQPSTTTVSVVAASAPATATQNIDFVTFVPTTVTFAPGEVSKTVTVQVIGDTTKEPIENYSIKLSAPSGVSLGDAVGTGRIADDD
jgi:hypothetical protein